MISNLLKLIFYGALLMNIYSCGINTNATIYKDDISINNYLESICVITNKFPLNNFDLTYENIVVEELINSKKFKSVIRIDSLISILGVDKGLIIHPNLSYLKTNYHITGIKYYLICSLGQYYDGHERTKSAYSCQLILRDIVSDSNLLVVNGAATGKYENAFLANWIQNRNSKNMIINSSSQNELLHPMTIKTVNTFLENIKK